MDNKRLDEAVFAALCEWFEDPNGDGLPDGAPGVEDWRRRMRAALLAGVKVLLGEPVAWQKPSVADAVVSAEHVAWYANSYPYRTTYGGWIPLYAPSLGEGDGR